MNRSIWRPILRATQHRYVYTKAPTSTPSLSITRIESSSYRGKSKQAKRRDEEPERWIGQTPLSERLHPNQRDVVLDSQKGVEQFLDIGSSAGSRRTGRSWRTSELRLKSFDDLHRLWYILLKERNVLLTEKAWCKTNGKYWTNGESNMTKVKMSMARVKGVVAERTRAEQHRRWVEEEKEMKKLQEKRVNYDLMFDDDGRRMKKPEHEMAKERSEKLDFFEKRDPEWRDKWMFEVELSRSRRRKWLRRRAN